MLSYKALSRASITLQKIEENSSYSCEIFSSNGNILQPYDINTTLTGIVYNNFEDITKEISSEDIKWTIWNERNDESLKKEWNDSHVGKNPITVSCDEINGKAIIQFEVYKSNNFGLKELITCNRITLIDINDLMATTTKPTNPYENQLWVDTSTTPAALLIWQNRKWNMVGTVTTVIKNLIKNSNFINYSYKPFDIVGNIKNQYIPVVKTVSGRKWLNIKSDVLSIENKGISQTTEKTEKINTNSKYSFQFLAYASIENTSYNNSIEVKISSVDKYNAETILYHGGSNKEITLNKNICRFFTSFTTLSNTERIKIEILGKTNSKYDFNITQLALYNTDNDYPWQSHPDDTSNILDSESIFNAFTNNGQIQGIYSAIDPVTGQVQYYFNAEYIKSGTIKGNLIDAKNLVVTNKNNEKTLYIDEDGNVYLTVSSLVIGSSNESLEDFINSNKNSKTEMLESMLLQIEKDHTVTNYVYNEIYNNTDFQLLGFNGDISVWLDEEDRPDFEIIKYMDLLFYVNKAYEKSLNNLKESIEKCKEDYETNKNSLSNNYNTYNKKIGIINKLFINCSNYISNAKIEAVNNSWSQIKIDLNGVTTDVGNLKEIYNIQDGKISSIESDLHSVKQEITPEAITTKVQNIVKTDDVITKHIESVATQTAQGFNQEVVDQLNGNFSKLEQTVNGFSETISGVQNKPNYRLDIYAPDGTVLRSATNTTIVYARIYNWDKEITDEIDVSKFNWYRRSKNKENDYYWNNEHGKGKKSITITTDDILSYATFYFTVDI